MSRHFSMSRFRLLSLAGLIWGAAGAIAPTAVRADVPLTRAEIESLYNSVDFIGDGQDARPATLNDWLNRGDAVRTLENARAELRFNDGSLARIGERATFWFVPNTRDFRLSNGTALLLIPPERGPSNIQTPSAVTGIQGTALVVRHIPQDCDEDFSTGETLPWEECTGRTVVMVLTESPKGPVEVTTTNGNTQALSAGNMAVIEGNSIQILEFNLELFYQTSPLVEGLNLDNPDYQGEGSPTDPVRRETWDGIQSQEGFEGSHLLNPDVFSLDADLSVTTSWLLPENSTRDFLTIDVIAGEGISDIDSVGNMGSRPMSGGSMSSRIGSSMTNVIIERANLPAGIIDPPDMQRRVTRNANSASPPLPVENTSTPGPAMPSPEPAPDPVASSPEPAMPLPEPAPDPIAPDPEPAMPLPEPAPDPIAPDPEPAMPLPEPAPDPVAPSPEPAMPSPEPVIPTPEPVTPTPEPVMPTPEPVTPTPEPVSPPGDQRPNPMPSDGFNPPGNPDPTPDPVFEPPGNPAPSQNSPTFNPPVNPPLNPPVQDVPPSTTPPVEAVQPPLQVDPLPNNTPSDVTTTPDPVTPGVVNPVEGRPTPVTPEPPPPVDIPPVETPPVDIPPVDIPPVETPPVDIPPVETPPVTPEPVPTPEAVEGTPAPVGSEDSPPATE